jgi:Undecaprenyl-phosphate glucose phosphotransferase
MTRRSINLTQFWLTVGFFLIPGLAFGIAGYLRFHTTLFAHAEVEVRSYLLFTAVVTLLWAFMVERLGLNRISILLTLRTGIATAAQISICCAALSLSLSFFYRTVTFARVFVLMGCGLLFALSFLLIHLARGILHAMDRSSRGRFPIAILGADQFAASVANRLSNNLLARCKVACFVTLPTQTPTSLDSPVLAWEQLEDVVEQFHCSEILICLPPEWIGQAQKILQFTQHLCIPARIVLDFGEGIFVPERVFEYCGIPLLDVRPYPVDTIGYALGKRLFDIAFSLLALLFGAPLMLAAALAIKLTSRGPVFFIQERIGMNGRHFRMIKFRSMSVQECRAANENHTARTDSRITPVGRFLRRTSLDELPQFYNVLRGDMSVVGPRPELTYFVQKFRGEIPSYMARHNVKCGITGWAQINGLRGSDTSIPNRIEYDLYYMRNWSMLFDIQIIYRTIIDALVSPQAY